MTNIDDLNNLIPLDSSNGNRNKKYDYKEVFNELPQMKSAVENLCCKIEHLKSSSDASIKTIILQGRHGSGKTALGLSVLQRIVKDDIFIKSHIWSVCMTHYSTSESFFQFLAQKAKELGQRELYQILLKSKKKPELRKKAAIEVSLHCKLLFLDNIDLKDGLDINFIKSILNTHVIIFCTASSNLYKENDGLHVYEIPRIEFSCLEEASTYIKEINDMHDSKEELLDITNNFGPFLASIIFRAIKQDLICVTKVQDILGKYKLVTNDALQLLLSFIFNNLIDDDKNMLVSIALMRMPLPLQQKEFAQNLQNVKLLKGFVTNGHNFIEAPTFVCSFIWKCCVGDNQQSFHSSHGLELAFDLWKDLLPVKLKELLKQAENHAWPFAPETWQYKEVIDESENYNLKDLIHKKNKFSDLEEINILQECLYSSLTNNNYKSAAALLFIMDRFIYWQGTSRGTISVLNYIQMMSPNTAIAPQLIIREARLLKNDGNIQGAERILNSLLDNKKELGQWKYQTIADHKLISSVCIQIKGDILRNLGLWATAAQDLINSIRGFRSLPKPDKKGWASSLSLLADAFQYMSVDDFINKLVDKYNLRASHPILEAMSCVEEAARLSIHSPLFYAKNKRRAGQLSMMYSKLLPEISVGKRNFLIFAATECLEGLRCHKSIASLESREQYYEFVHCVHKIAQVCQELANLPEQQRVEINEDLITVLNDISMLLYEHYCSLEMKFQHSDWSSKLIRSTLKLLLLPEIPAVENSLIPEDQLKANLEIQSGKSLMENHVEDSGYLSGLPISRVDITRMTTIEDESKDQELESDNIFDQLRTARTIGTNEDNLATCDTDECHIRVAATIVETVDDMANNEKQSNGNSETSSGESFESNSDDKLLVCQEDTRLTVEIEPTSVDAKKRMQETMLTFEECRTVEKESKDLKEMLNTMKHNKRKKVHGANVWRYDPQTRKWTSAETLAYVGERLELGKKEGACRDAYLFEYINQEEPMSKYIGKQYKLEKYKNKPRTMRQYKQDIICQVTSRYYVTQFNQEMYKKGLPFGQVQFLPAVLIELKDVKNEPEKYFNVEPYMAGEFRKITNNFKWVEEEDVQGKDLLLAFSHFSFCFSNGKLIIVDIQGWTSDDENGATFLTDPQIHTQDKKGYGTANKGSDGFNEFWISQHPRCNNICKSLTLKRPFTPAAD